MSTSEFLSRLRERDVRLWVEDGRLKCDAPPGVLDADLRAEPPVPGARPGHDADGRDAWFVPDPARPGKYLQVEVATHG